MRAVMRHLFSTDRNEDRRLVSQSSRYWGLARRAALGMTTGAAMLLASAAAAAQPAVARPAAPSGKLWHHDKNLVGREGSAVSDIKTGAHRALGTYRFPVPTRDASRYLEERYDTSERTTEILVRRSSDGSVIERLVVDGAITDIEFSPTNNGLIRMTWGENALSYTTYSVFDLAAQRVLWADDDRNRTRSTAWLPDGRLLSISSRGVISALALTGPAEKTVLGRLSLPAGKVPLDLAASPKGDLILIDIADVDARGRVLRHDYWAAALDGSGLRQLTDAGGRASRPIFSPDGQFIAFRMSYGTSDLVSTCNLRYVPTAARMVSRSSSDAKEFVGLKDSTGKVHPDGLGCELMAWLP